MNIDPHAWLLTAPITLALIQLHFQPRDFVLKRWWRQMRQVEAETWFRLGRGTWYADDAGSAGTAGSGMEGASARTGTRLGSTLFAFFVLTFGAATVASFAAFIGIA